MRRNNKEEIRPQEQSEKAESFRENLRNEIQLKGHKDRNRHENRLKGVGMLGWFMSKTSTTTSPLREDELVTQLDNALSPVNNKGLHKGCRPQVIEKKKKKRAYLCSAGTQHENLHPAG